jgi:carbon-monoxide dehydrogenase medium subunit
MKPPPFSYHAPTTVAEAIDLLGRYDGDAKVVAGGQSLLPLLNFRLSRPAALVDINRIPGLDYIRADGGMLEIGAVTRHRAVERSAVVAAHCPLLAEAVRQIGHFQIRNRGTIGGSIAHADPAAELPTVLTALGGEVVITGPGGVRTATASEFFITLFTTSLGSDELVTAVRFPTLGPGTGSAFRELARRSGDFALVAVAAALALDETGAVRSARIALGGVDLVPVRAAGAEAFLAGKRPDPATLAKAAALVAGEINPESDLHATAEYRRALAAVLTGEALETAARRAAEGGECAHA